MLASHQNLCWLVCRSRLDKYLSVEQCRAQSVSCKAKEGACWVESCRNKPDARHGRVTDGVFHGREAAVFAIIPARETRRSHCSKEKVIYHTPRIPKATSRSAKEATSSVIVRWRSECRSAGRSEGWWSETSCQPRRVAMEAWRECKTNMGITREEHVRRTYLKSCWCLYQSRQRRRRQTHCWSGCSGRSHHHRNQKTSLRLSQMR